jgi:hypothetical protein
MLFNPDSDKSPLKCVYASAGGVQTLATRPSFPFSEARTDLRLRVHVTGNSFSMVNKWTQCAGHLTSAPPADAEYRRVSLLKINI